MLTARIANQKSEIPAGRATSRLLRYNLRRGSMCCKALPPTTLKVAGVSLRILIVDDLPANVLLLEGMLRNAGYTNITSTTQANTACQSHRQYLAMAVGRLPNAMSSAGLSISCILR